MRKEIRLGLFIVLTLGILAGGVFLIGSHQSLFQSTWPVKAEFKRVAGLGPGADVRVGGIHKGSVRSITLPSRPDGDVTVVMDVKAETRAVLKKDSVATIRSEGLLGDKYVEISFGSVEMPALKNGDTVKSEVPLDISDLFNKANGILDTTQSAIQNVSETAANMTSITGKINRGQGTAGELINDKKIYSDAQASATALRENMEALKHNFLTRGFFNKRGYEDSDEITKHEISQLPSGRPEKVFTYDAKQLFEKPDTAKLKNRGMLNEAGKYLEGQKTGPIVVSASMGLKGDTEKDRTLTEARSSVIRDYLAANFRLDDTRIATMGVGKSDDAGDSGNVRIMIYPQGTAAIHPTGSAAAKKP